MFSFGIPAPQPQNEFLRRNEYTPMTNEEYALARKQGLHSYRKAVLAGHFPYLPSLDQMLGQSGTLAEEPVGILEIPLSLIAGTRTSGRQNAFAPDFMPLLEEASEFAQKWQNLYNAQIEEGFREPIKVYEYLHRFYVLEGNKRVSVAAYLKVPQISADVIRLLPAAKPGDDAASSGSGFLEFFKSTRLYLPEFSEDASYRKLAGLLGKEPGTLWPQEDIENLRSAYYTFEQQYSASGLPQHEGTAGDAFLVYLSVYRLDSLLREPFALIRKRIQKLRYEFMTDLGGGGTKLVDTPVSEPRMDVLRLLPGRRQAYTETAPLRAAFFYEKDPASSRWIYGHELGRLALADAFPDIVKTFRFDNIADEEAFQHAVRTAAADGCDVIFTTSASMMDETRRAAIEYPEIHFLNCSVNLPVHAVRTYYARMYEAKYLMGAAAAAAAANHRIGYCADYPIYGNIASINAFAAGAALVDPSAEIFLSWLSMGEGTDDWRQQFAGKDIRIISGPDLIRPADARPEYGLYEELPDGTVSHLAMPAVNWGRYYELIIRTILTGSWNARELTPKNRATGYWYGLSAGVIDVILSQRLPNSTKSLITVLKKSISDGTLHPFAGELRSQNGLILPEGAPPLSAEEIITMNWLCDNVRGSIPVIDEVAPSARGTVSVSGVKPANTPAGDPL